jgi:hypothetical protein
VRLLRARDAINGEGMNALCYQPEEMKLLLEELCSESGVRVQLHTRVTAAYRDGRRLDTIVTESKSGRQSWRAPVFIDTTGDGDLAAQAGCEFEIGREKSCPCQPMTMYALLVVKDAALIADCLYGTGIHGRHTGRQAFRDVLARAGVTPSYGAACRSPPRRNRSVSETEGGFAAASSSRVMISSQARGRTTPSCGPPFRSTSTPSPPRPTS